MSNNTFDPQDTDLKFYILGDSSLLDIISLVKNKWGEDTDLDYVTIESDYIHTRCLNYDIYDPSDYDEYLVVTLNN